MNKKILLVLLLALTPTAFVSAQTLSGMATKLQTVAIAVGTPIVTVGWVIAGILWLTAAGAPDKMGVAKKAIMACVVGTLLIVLAAASNGIISVIKDAFGLNAQTL